MAQTLPAWGYPQYGYTNRQRSVAVYTGDINGTFSIPLLSKPGRAGLDAAFSLAYNNTLYLNSGGSEPSFEPLENVFGSPGVASWGWQLIPPTGAITYRKVEQTCYGPPPCRYSKPIPYSYFDYTGFAFYDASGTRHPFAFAVTTSNACNTGSGGGTITDGSGYTMTVTLSGGISVAATVTGPDGRFYNGALVEDTNGNEITSATTVQGSTTEIDWTDTTGALVAKWIEQSGGCTAPNGTAYPYCAEFERPAPGGSRYVAYTLAYENARVGTAASCSGVADWSGTAQLPVALFLPQYTSGSKWLYQFTYGGAGRLTAINYPGGAVTSYAYSNMCTFANGSASEDGGVETMTVTENDGQGHTGRTTYTRDSPSQTTLTRPDGSDTVVTYDSGGLPTDVKNYDTNGTALLSETVYTNTGGTPDRPATAVTYLNGTKVAERDTSFDDYGNLLSETGIDWAGDPSGNTKRVTSITYLYQQHAAYKTANILDRPAEIKVTDGAGNVCSDTVIAYITTPVPRAWWPLLAPSTTTPNIPPPTPNAATRPRSRVP